jgi:hypothetical protein
MEADNSDKITSSDYDYAFTELASILYEQYRKQKQIELTDN